MAEKEIRRHPVINCAIEGKCSVKQAAELLKLSRRRIKQIKKEVKEVGVQAVIHGNKQHKRLHSFSTEIRDKIISLKTSYGYQLCNFANFQELPEENEDIVISCLALHSLLTNAGIKTLRNTENRRSIFLGRGGTPKG